MHIWRYAVNDDIQYVADVWWHIGNIWKNVPSASFRFTMLLFTALNLAFNSTWFAFPLMNPCKVSYWDNWSKHTVFHQIPVSIIQCAWKEEIHVPPGPTSRPRSLVCLLKNQLTPSSTVDRLLCGQICSVQLDFGRFWLIWAIIIIGSKKLWSGSKHALCGQNAHR